jgi:hypothetical protein
VAQRVLKKESKSAPTQIKGAGVYVMIKVF